MLTPADFHAYQTRAIRFVKDNLRSMLWLEMSLGKMQPEDEPVLTPDGWVSIGDLYPGALVIGGDGSPTTVTARFEHLSKPIYKITMVDGAWTRCGLEHLWSVRRRPGDTAFVTMSTQQVLDAGLTDENGDAVWQIPVLPDAEVRERFIKSIEPHSVQDAVCIQVSAPDGLYVTRDYIVTHNTVIGLTAFTELQDELKVYRAIVLAPRRVAETVWRQEVEKWSHLRGRVNVVLLRGTNETKMRNLHRKDADIFVINFESIPWLVRTVNDQFLARGKYPPFNMLVIDEIDRLKNASGKRYQMVEKLFPYFSVRVGMTGTHASNGYGDLHGQYKCIDDGARLFKNISDFRTKWMQAGYAELTWELREGAKEDIENRIKDITLSMSAADYLTLPDYRYHEHWVDLEPKIQKEYDRLEKELFAQLDRHAADPIDGDWMLEVHTALSARTKCRQLANGAVLNPDNSGTVMLVHDAKLEMLDSIVHEAGGNPMILVYMFRHDMHRIKERYEKGGYRIGYIGPGTKDVEQVINAWNSKKYHILMSHPACLRGDTQILTERRGWVPITDVRSDERVFDGVEYVNHGGRAYSGFKPVIDVFGIKMTPNHKLLLDGEWVEAKDVDTGTKTREAARYTYQNYADGGGTVQQLRSRHGDAGTEFPEAQPKRREPLCRLHKGYVSQYDENTFLPHLDGDAHPMLVGTGRGLPSLRWSRCACVRAVGVFRELLRRYVRRLFRRVDDRKDRRGWELRTQELPLGYQHGTASQQAQQPGLGVPGRVSAPSRTVPQNRSKQDENASSFEPRDDPRGGCKLSTRINLRNRANREERARVYDLVNCGPRNRFLIRNAQGEMFVSHNSFGHGLNLHYGGHDIVWFSPTDNLAYYQQSNARLRRQGQTAPNINVRLILARNTIDAPMMQMLDRKAVTAEELKQAIEAYRRTK